MTYSLLTRSFGISSAGYKVQITDSVTGKPALILSSPTGGVASTSGIAIINGVGDINVYVDDASTWTVTVIDEDTTYVDESILNSSEVSILKQLATGAAHISTSSGLNLYVPPIVDVTRNSVNDSTDANEQTLATLVIPANTLRLGSIVEVWALWENTNSAAVKTLNLRWNGTSVGSIPVTTNQSTGFRTGYHIHNSSTIAFINSVTGTGGGSVSGLVQAQAMSNVMTTTNTLTLTCKWAAATAGEFIRLKHAKLNLMI